MCHEAVIPSITCLVHHDTRDMTYLTHLLYLDSLSTMLIVGANTGHLLMLHYEYHFHGFVTGLPTTDPSLLVPLYWTPLIVYPVLVPLLFPILVPPTSPSYTHVEQRVRHVF